MTNEEAIKLLKAMMDEMILVFYRDRREALKTAISALEKQDVPDTNVGDLISRQDAIDALARTAREAFNLSDEYNQYLAGLIDGESAIRQLPSVQSEQRWIPCSERLPDNDERVLATTAWGDVTIAERIYPPINDTCWFIHDGNTNATIDDVVAWMPLPEPYQAERREERRKSDVKST